MTAFTEVSGVEARNGHPHRRDTLRSRFKRVTFSQSALKYPQLIGHQIHNSLTKRHAIVVNCKAYSNRTVTDNVIKRGGDKPML